ncbi:MAG: hypothetical protein F2808_02380 [Actinobacteria bacterium]|nr:hypothetical protein [Actinomycetota bacterium]
MSDGDAVIDVSTEHLHMLASGLDNWALHLDNCASRLRSAHESHVLPTVGPQHRIAQVLARLARMARNDAQTIAHLAQRYEFNESHGQNFWQVVATTWNPAVVGTSLMAGLVAFAHPTARSVSFFRQTMTQATEQFSRSIVATGVRPIRQSAHHISTNPGSDEPCRPPASMVDLISRIPAVAADKPQVRVERTSTTAFVYIGGTVTSALNGGKEPWDMTSNLVAIAGQQSDSEVGVRKIMQSPAVTSADNVVVVGHSQGGLIAQRVTALGNPNVSDVVLVGAPTARVEMPAGVRIVAIENTNDPVPALGGQTPPGKVDVTFRRDAPVTSNDSLGAHHLSSYRSTAHAFDASTSPLLRATERQLFVRRESEVCVATDWRVDRSS